MTKLNLGCGPHTIPGWICYDQDFSPGVTTLDLSRGKLPHVDNSVDFIFSEHFLEHVEKNQAIELLKECHRVLRPSGVMRLVMPDLEYLLRNYFQWKGVGNDLMAPIPDIWEPMSPCDMVNEGMRMWGHKYLWDYDTLFSTLSILKFQDITIEDWRKSVHEELKNLEVRPYFGELIVEFGK